MYRTFAAAILGLIILHTPVRAGLYYSGEEYASLPTQWRGFLLDQRALRNVGVKPKDIADESPMRTRYREEAAKLRTRKQPLSTDEIADLGAIHLRLGEVTAALEILRPAQRAHPNHFAIAANLGSAWQMQGDYRQAAAALEEAVRLAPGKYLAVEEAHLKLVRLRERGKAGDLDDLFGIRYVDDKGAYEPGKFAAAQMKKLPSKAVAIAQQLALWFPGDGPLLWQLAELANAHGDFRNGAAMMEGCVVQFGMQNPILRKHRLLLKDAVENFPMAKVGDHEGVEQHQGTLAFRSRRPLLSKLETFALPPIDPKGINPIPWELFAETGLEKPFKVQFPKYMRELEGKQISMTGFMYPLGEDPEMSAFLFIEAPVGCWYCEMPETTGIVFVEMPRGKTTQFQRGLVRIIGRLELNGTDPEEFLYNVRNARVGALD